MRGWCVHMALARLAKEKIVREWLERAVSANRKASVSEERKVNVLRVGCRSGGGDLDGWQKPRLT